MTRPDASCLCVDLGIWAATTTDGPSRTRMLDAFLEAHSGPGHQLEQPPRDWYKREAELGRLLARLKP
jgi:phage-related protein